jgi:TonB family protein
MTESSKQWEGQIVAGIFPLRQYLGGSEHSAVFLTEHGEERQKAAIKLTPADPSTADSQISQWEAAAQLSHPNLLKLLDGGRCRIDGNDLLYLVMEFADENLSQILPERALTVDETRDMLGPVLDALQFLHGKGFVHGDVKPANILAIGDKLKLSSDAICRAGEAPGVSKKAGSYDPPEAISGKASSAGDVWALGTALVEVLTQHLPDWQRGGDAEPTVPATLPAPFLEIARQCLRMDPQRRISIADISAQLSSPEPLASAAVAGVNVSVSTAAPTPPPPMMAQRPIVSQATPPRPAMRPMPSPRPPNYYGEARQKPRFMVPLIVGALMLAAIVAVPRLLTHRPAAGPVAVTASGKSSSEPAVQKAVPAAAAPHSDGRTAKQEQAAASRNTAPVATPPEEKAAQNSAQPPAVEPVKTISETARPSPATPAATTALASEKVAKTAVPGTGPARGEVLDQILPDVSQKARATIHGKVRVSVKVHVDSAGAVSDAELDSPGPSKFFSDLALQAARKWVFSPPELDGKSVASEWRLRFDFRQKETTVVPTQTAP